MSADTILMELRQQLALKVKERDAAQKRIDQLQIAICAIEGKETPADGNGEGKSVTDVCEDAVLQFSPEQVFDFHEITRAAVALAPDMEGRIKRGVYNAVATMKRNQTIKKVPGGLMRNTPKAISA